MVPSSRIEYSCPLHPQIVRDAPAFCPICGMALEPRTVSADDENPELVSMTRRFWVGGCARASTARGHGLGHLAHSPDSTLVIGGSTRLD